LADNQSTATCVCAMRHASEPFIAPYLSANARARRSIFPRLTLQTDSALSQEARARKIMRNLRGATQTYICTHCRANARILSHGTLHGQHHVVMIKRKNDHHTLHKCTKISYRLARTASQRVFAGCTLETQTCLRATGEKPQRQESPSKTKIEMWKISIEKALKETLLSDARTDSHVISGLPALYLPAAHCSPGK
jgi:hypothetical protein